MTEPHKPTYDSQGREIFTVHPEILAGSADYRKLPTTSTTASDGQGPEDD